MKILVNALFLMTCLFILSAQSSPAEAATRFEFSTFEQWDNNIYRASNPLFIRSDTFTSASFTATDYEKAGDGYLILQGRYDGLFYGTRTDLNLSMTTLALGWWGQFPGITQYQILAKYRSRSYQNYLGSSSYGGSIDFYQQWQEFSFQERYEMERVSTSDGVMNYTNNGLSLYSYWKPFSTVTLGAGYHWGFGNINYALTPPPFDSNTQGWSLFANYAFSSAWVWTLGYEDQSATLNPAGTPATAARQVVYTGIYFKL